MEAIPETKIRALIYLKQDGREETWDIDLDWAEVTTDEQFPDVIYGARSFIPITSKEFSIKGSSKNLTLQVGSAPFETELRSRFDKLWREWSNLVGSTVFRRHAKELALKFWLTAHGLETP